MNQTIEAGGAGFTPPAANPADFLALLTTAPGAVLVADAHGHYLEANDDACSLLGYDRAELVRLGVADVVVAEPTVAASEHRRFVAEGSWEGEIGLRRKDGSVVVVAGRAITVLGPESPVSASFLREVAAREAAEATLRTSEARFQALIEYAADAVTLLDADCRITYASPAHQRLLGIAPDDLIGRHASELVHPDDRAAFCGKLVERTTGTTRPEPITFRARHANGSWRWVESVATNRLDDPAVGGIVVNTRDVTDGVAAEAATRASEARFRAAFADAPIGMALTTPEGRFVQVNRALCDILGCSEEELAGLAIQDVTHPGDLDIDSEEAAWLLAGEVGAYQVEKRYVHRDGHVIWGRLSASQVRDEAGQPCYFVSQIQDITPFKAAGTALRASEARLRLALEAASMGGWERDAVTGKAYRSPGLPGLFGLPPEDVSAPRARYIARVHPDDRAKVREADRQLLQSTSALELEFRIITADGQVRWLRERGKAITGPDGKLDRAIGVTQDVTEEKLAGARQRALLAALPDMIFRMDRKGTYLDYKPEAKDDLAAPPEAILGRTVQEVLPAEVAAAVEAAIGRILAESGQETVEFELDLPVGHRAYEARMVAAGDNEVVAAVRDVTERKAAEADLRAAKEAAESANRAKSEFLSTMSHELRTPLTAIMGYADLIQMEGALAPAQEADAAQVLRSAQHLLAIINGVLDIARIEAGRLELDLGKIDLATVAEEVRYGVAPQAATKGVALVMDVPPTLPTICTDSLRLQQILLNLVGNAVKFTDHGRVSLAARVIRGDMEISVTDTGIGIAPEAQERIFGAFTQADGTVEQRYGGSGLGLAITRRLVELHGGTITVESEQGVGSTFTVRLPLTGPAPNSAIAMPNGRGA